MSYLGSHYNKKLENLIEALRAGNLKQIKQCIEKGADLKSVLPEAFFNSCIKGHLDVLDYLVKEHGVDIHMNGDVGLQEATKHERTEIVHYLKKRIALEILNEI
jgi:hypothetical protein